MIADHFRDKWTSPAIGLPITINPFAPVSIVGRDEFEALKKEVLEMKELLKRAKAYDEKNGEPDCEIDEKMDLLRRVAAMVGVNLDDVIRKKEKRE